MPDGASILQACGQAGAYVSGAARTGRRELCSQECSRWPYRLLLLCCAVLHRASQLPPSLLPVHAQVPTLCTHPRLPTTPGTCRICLVETGGGRLQPACATPAWDGMSVQTATPKVKVGAGGCGWVRMGGSVVCLRVASGRPPRLSPR